LRFKFINYKKKKLRQYSVQPVECSLFALLLIRTRLPYRNNTTPVLTSVLLIQWIQVLFRYGSLLLFPSSVC